MTFLEFWDLFYFLYLGILFTVLCIEFLRLVAEIGFVLCDMIGMVLESSNESLDPYGDMDTIEGDQVERWNGLTREERVKLLDRNEIEKSMSSNESYDPYGDIEVTEWGLENIDGLVDWNKSSKDERVAWVKRAEQTKIEECATELKTFLSGGCAGVQRLKLVWENVCIFYHSDNTAGWRQSCRLAFSGWAGFPAMERMDWDLSKLEPEDGEVFV